MKIETSETFLNEITNFQIKNRVANDTNTENVR